MEKSIVKRNSNKTIAVSESNQTAFTVPVARTAQPARHGQYRLTSGCNGSLGDAVMIGSTFMSRAEYIATLQN